MVPERFTYPSPGFDHFWTEGHGRELLKKLDWIPDKASIEAHIPKLAEHDSLADEVIREVYLKMGFKEADVLLKQVLEQGIGQVANVPECLKNLFAQVDEIPEWLDKSKVEKGSVFCRRSGVMGLLVLRNYSLMGGYESAAINKPLIFTGALKKGAVKRITDTTEFWIDITGENALDRFETGFKSTIKTRLIHAFARVSILKTPEWKNESWGIPINQWDMLATNLGFSLVFLNGLVNLGLRPGKDELEGLFHFWKYVGYLLGIPPEYLPSTEKEAIEELYKWTMSQPPADEDTKTLAVALMDEPLLARYPKYSWQKKLIVQTHLSYNYFFLGDRSCKTMNLRPAKLRFYPYLVRFLKGVDEFFVLRSRKYYNRSVKRGRKSQKKIKEIILKLHGLDKR